MMRYWPAKGTAGLARSRVRGNSLSPAPPASKTPSVSLITRTPRSLNLEPLSSDARKESRVSRETRVYHDEIDFVTFRGAGRREGKPNGGCWASADVGRQLILRVQQPRRSLRQG
jgi:hypothetical protein